MPQPRLGALLALALLLAWAGVGGAQPACTHYASPSGGGNGASQGSPFLIANFMSIAAPGHVLCLLNGTYTGSGDKIEVGSTPSGTAGQPITVRALNDGGAFIDGQNARRIFFFNGTSYWTVQGIDFGNNGDQFSNALDLVGGAHHITVQRVCIWNARIPTAGVYSNQHVMGMTNSHHNLFEDVCAFGYGRNTFIPFEDQTKDNVFRRIWLRWDGYPDGAGAGCPGPTIQTQYHTHHSNDIYENFINIFSGGLYKPLYSGPSDPNHMNGFPCPSLPGGWVTRTGMLDGVAGPKWLGQIFYGYPANKDIIGTNEGIGMQSRYTAMRIADAFVDARWSRLDNVSFNIYACDVADPSNSDLAVAGSCSQLFIDRVTSIIQAGQATGTLGPSGANLSNIHECTALGSCPSFYTGDGPSTGSRSCFEYQNGTLTSTPLWPWRMDDRIKQALVRSGIGPTLSGTAGTGYGANTVTSEIVSRYGALPAACTRSGGGGPPLPGGPASAWWKFDEGSGNTAIDSAVGAAHPLSIVGGLTWVPGRVGPFALKCDGVGGYGEQGTPFPIDTNQYTVMTWIKGPAPPGTTLDIVLKNGLDSETWGFAWGHPDPNTQQAWWHRLADGTYVQAKLTTPLLGNVWYHIAFTYDGTYLRAYLNGALQVTTPVSTPIAPAGTFRVCRGGIVTTFAGTLDDGKVWDRALSDTEVAQEYASPVSMPRRHKIVQQ